LKYRNRKQATAYLRDNGIPCGDLTLAHHATAGTGPQFRYPVYTEDDLDAWIEARLSAPVRSPAEAIACFEAQTFNKSEDELSPLTRSTRPGRKRRGRPPRAHIDQYELPTE